MNKCIDCKKKISINAKRCRHCARVFDYIQYPYLKKIMSKNLPKDRKGSKNSMWHKKHSKRTRKLFSSIRKGKNNPMYNKKHTEKAIKKMKLKKLGMKLTENHRKNIIKSLLGRKHSNKTKLKMSRIKYVNHHIYLKENSDKILQLARTKHNLIHNKIYSYVYIKFGKRGIDNYIKWFDKKYGLTVKKER